MISYSLRLRFFISFIIIRINAWFVKGVLKKWGCEAGKETAGIAKGEGASM